MPNGMFDNTNPSELWMMSIRLERRERKRMLTFLPSCLDRFCLGFLALLESLRIFVLLFLRFLGGLNIRVR